MRTDDGERAKNVCSRKRESGTRSARAHRRRKRGGAVSGGIGCLDQSRSRNRTQGNRLQANGGGSVARGRQPGGARERVAHRFERTSIRVSWRVLTEIRLCVREFEPPYTRGFRFPQINRSRMRGLGKKGGQAPSPTAVFRKNPPEIASALAPGSRDHAAKERGWHHIFRDGEASCILAWQERMRVTGGRGQCHIPKNLTAFYRFGECDIDPVPLSHPAPLCHSPRAFIMRGRA